LARSQLGQTIEADEIDAIARFLMTLTGEYDGHPVGSPDVPR